MPVMVRTTEDMLNLVPQSMRDGSAALGAQPWRTITRIIYPAAAQRPGDRRAAGGGAHQRRDRAAAVHGAEQPVLEHRISTQPMANLPVVIFQFAMSPYADWQQLAWVGALLITLFVLLLSIIARSISSLFGQHANPGE